MDIKNKRDSPNQYEKFGSSRKRTSEVLSQSKLFRKNSLKAIENTFDVDRLNGYSMGLKRRCDRSIFDHGDDVCFIKYNFLIYIGLSKKDILLQKDFS